MEKHIDGTREVVTTIPQPTPDLPATPAAPAPRPPASVVTDPGYAPLTPRPTGYPPVVPPTDGPRGPR